MSTVRPTSLRCSCCTRWLRDEEFHVYAHARERRQRQYWCKDCTTLNRRFRRQKGLS